MTPERKQEILDIVQSVREEHQESEFSRCVRRSLCHIGELETLLEKAEKQLDEYLNKA